MKKKFFYSKPEDKYMIELMRGGEEGTPAHVPFLGVSGLIACITRNTHGRLLASTYISYMCNS